MNKINNIMTTINYEAGGSKYSKPFDFEGKGKYRDTEPMLMLDTTGSMEDTTSLNGTIKRKDIAYWIIKGIVTELTKLDSAAQKQEEEEGGGLKTTLFARDNVVDFGDINPQNLDDKWRRIRWGGGTTILPGWKNLMGNYQREFRGVPIDEQPLQLITIVTDGEAEDLEEFAKKLETEEDAYVTVVVLGYFNPYYDIKSDPHTRVINAFNALAAKNNRVRIIDATSSIDHSTICAAVLERATQTR